jgi:hypothetical protein
MDKSLIRKIIVGVGGGVALIAILITLYIMVVKPKLKGWNDVRVEVKKLEKKRDELREIFANQNDPRVELKILQQEIDSLETANRGFDKIKKPGVEAGDLPKELKDPDQQIRLELFRDYLKEVMSIAEQNIKSDLEEAGIVAPTLELYTELAHPQEAAYYMNRAGGLKGLVNTIIKTKSATNKKILFDSLEIEGYRAGTKRRAAAGNTLSYSVEMIMDMQSLMAFAYNLNEEDGYYFFEQMTIKPVPRRRTSGGEVVLLVNARVNTVRIYKSEVMSAVKKAMKKSAEASKKKASSGKLTGFLALAVGGGGSEGEGGGTSEKKWYEFWK